jgi:hypothetical protein
MHPMKSVLNFISERLPITRQKIVMVERADDIDSDSDTDDGMYYVMYLYVLYKTYTL